MSAEGLEIGGLPLRVVRHARARRWKLAFDPVARGLRLTVPARGSEARAIAWARGQDAWVARQAARVAAVPAGAAESVDYEGLPLRLIHDPARRRGAVRRDDRLEIGGAAERVPAVAARWLRAEALRLLSEDTAEIAARAGVRVSRVGVGDARTRWGSCTGGGAIRYSWRLVMAPRWVRRATVAHEVAHRVHMDHSARFHALVATIADDPADPGAARRWLRAHGARLHSFASDLS